MSQNETNPPHTAHVDPIGVTVTHQYGDAFEIDARGHRLLVDQPVDAGGADLGPTPTELFAASLAACVCVYAMGFLRRHSLAADGLRVHCQAIMSSDCPARVAAATLRLEGLPALAEGQRAALLAVVDHCTVHNSIRQAPQVRIELDATTTRDPSEPMHEGRRGEGRRARATN